MVHSVAHTKRSYNFASKIAIDETLLFVGVVLRMPDEVEVACVS